MKTCFLAGMIRWENMYTETTTTTTQDTTQSTSHTRTARLNNVKQHEPDIIWSHVPNTTATATDSLTENWLACAPFKK